MKYIILAVFAIIFIVAVLVFTSWKIAKELIIPEKKEKGYSKPQFPHEKRFKIQSPNGYSMSCTFIPIDDGMSLSVKTVIILHQFGSCKEDASRYAEIFTALGYSVIIPDMRAHGESGGEYSSMGFYESDDVSAIIRWLKDCYGRDVFYGIFGIADGATAAILYAQKDPDVKFVIADSPFGNLHSLYMSVFRSRYKVKPFPILNFTEAIIKTMGGFEPKKVRVDKFFNSKNSIHDFPLMLIHGDCDKRIPPQMSVDIYNMKKEGIKTLYLAPDCGHLEAFEKEKESYIGKIHGFIEENT